MTLPVYGNTLNIVQIATEFGAPNTANITMSELYAGGAYVPSGTVGYPSGGAATAIPTSGAISFNNFFGATAITYFYGYRFANTNQTIQGIAFDNTGNIVYGQYDSTNKLVEYSKISANGSSVNWFVQTSVNSTGTLGCNLTNLILDTAGNNIYTSYEVTVTLGKGVQYVADYQFLNSSGANLFSIAPTYLTSTGGTNPFICVDPNSNTYLISSYYLTKVYANGTTTTGAGLTYPPSTPTSITFCNSPLPMLIVGYQSSPNYAPGITSLDAGNVHISNWSMVSNNNSTNLQIESITTDTSANSIYLLFVDNGANSSTVAKFYNNGIFQWAKTISSSNSLNFTHLTQIGLDSSNNIYLGGSLLSNTTSGNGLMISLYANGNLNWGATYHEATNGSVYTIVSDLAINPTKRGLGAVLTSRWSSGILVVSTTSGGPFGTYGNLTITNVTSQFSITSNSPLYTGWSSNTFTSNTMTPGTNTANVTSANTTYTNLTIQLT